MQETTATITEFLSAAYARPSVRILTIVVVAAVLIWVTRLLSRRIDGRIRASSNLAPTEGLKRLRTLESVIRYVLITLIFAIAVMMVLRELGVDPTPLIAGAGIAGIVIGMGAQNIVRDFLSGIFMMLENQYSVGDWVRIGGVSGGVERLTLRITQLRDAEGNAHFVPNGQITAVTNLTKGWARAVLDVGIAYKENVDRVIEVLKDVGEELADDPDWADRLTAPLEVQGVQDLADSAVLIRIRFATLPDARWEVLREMRRRVKNRFDAEGIEIPFPHRTLYVGTGESGTLKVDEIRRDG